MNLDKDDDAHVPGGWLAYCDCARAAQREPQRDDSGATTAPKALIEERSLASRD